MKEIFIERRRDLLRIAIKDNGKLIQCFIEEDNEEPFPGEIYKGVVKNIIPAIKSAFLDIGKNKNAYLYIDGKYEKRGIKNGQELIVEVLKEGIGDKGAKVTTAFSLAGRYCVLNTDNKELGFSSKIKGMNYINEAKEAISKPEDIGIKVRTNGQFAAYDDINLEIQELYRQYEGIVKEAPHKMKPGLLYSDGGILARMLRDNVDLLRAKIIVDNESDFKIINSVLKGIKNTEIALELYNDTRSLFDAKGIEKELLALRNSRVNLSCGGYIVIEKTEAMYVIDVNTGSNVSGYMLEKTAYNTNIEAAKTAAAEIMLRNLSGIILIDFVDMKSTESKKAVLNQLKKAFEGDKNNTVIYPFTELNLIQIARRRRGKNIYDFMEEDCCSCEGRGKRLKLSYILLLIKNEILKRDNDNNIHNFYVEINLYYKEAIMKIIEDFKSEIADNKKEIYLNFTDNIEVFKVEALVYENQIKLYEDLKLP